MKLRMTGMTAALAVGITLAVVIASSAGAYVYSRLLSTRLLSTAGDAAMAQGELIRNALEHQMMENDRSLIGHMIETFGEEPGIEGVMLLDRLGRVQFSSAPTRSGPDLAITSPTCQACHQYPPDKRMSSRVIEGGPGTLVRTVIPIRNQKRCHACHDPRQQINGVLLVDTNVGPIKAQMNRDLAWMVGGTVLLILALVSAIGLIFRLVVMRRLQRFETTARLIASGDLERRVPADGSDTVAWLAREFNQLADSLSGLLMENREQRERLETVINSIDDGIVVLSPERRVIAANDAFLRRTGHARDAVLGAPCLHVTEGMCGPTDCPTHACLNTGERQVRICERRSPAGETIWEEVHSSPICDRSGRTLQVVEVWRDISKRREAEAQLAESHRLASLGLLASGFSHEMNTPLATTLTCVEGILRDAQPGGAGDSGSIVRIGESARVAREQLLRCRGITQHFLRLASGKSTHTDLLEVAPTLAAVVRLISPTARAHGVTIELEPVPEGVRVRANDSELQHVLLNLLLNAIEASGAKGVVRIDVDATDPVVLRVTDNGCGIGIEDQKRIFEPFCSFRKGGTGLGLFLSLNFARRWGGTIRVRSAPGAGSTFEVVIPSTAARGSLRVIQ